MLVDIVPTFRHSFVNIRGLMEVFFI